MNVSVISAGINTDWMELSDAAGEAGSLCYVTDGRVLNYPSRNVVQEQQFAYIYICINVRLQHENVTMEVTYISAPAPLMSKPLTVFLILLFSFICG